jgi:hypothetical protein
MLHHMGNAYLRIGPKVFSGQFFVIKIFLIEKRWRFRSTGHHMCADAERKGAVMQEQGAPAATGEVASDEGFDADNAGSGSQALEVLSRWSGKSASSFQCKDPTNSSHLRVPCDARPARSASAEHAADARPPSNLEDDRFLGKPVAAEKCDLQASRKGDLEVSRTGDLDASRKSDTLKVASKKGPECPLDHNVASAISWTTARKITLIGAGARPIARDSDETVADGGDFRSVPDNERARGAPSAASLLCQLPDADELGDIQGCSSSSNALGLEPSNTSGNTSEGFDFGGLAAAAETTVTVDSKYLGSTAPLPGSENTALEPAPTPGKSTLLTLETALVGVNPENSQAALSVSGGFQAVTQCSKAGNSSGAIEKNEKKKKQRMKRVVVRQRLPLKSSTFRIRCRDPEVRHTMLCHSTLSNDVAELLCQIPAETLPTLCETT